jgi:murein DD-endopeptidase MepM/ murein hydrolase activator NlpD
MLQSGIEKSIRDISMAEGTTLVETLLGDRNISEFLFHVDNQLNFNNAIQKMIYDVRTEKQKVETDKNQTEEQKKSLLALKTELSGKKKAVDNTKSEQADILKSTKNEEKTYQKILSDKQALKAAFEKEVFEYEAKLKYNGNLADLPKAGSSAFAWPVENVRITQTFGKTVASKKLYVSGSHNGVDFGVPAGTKVMALANGVIAGTGDTDLTCKGASFGRWILIKFDNGLAATYGHLTVISVKQGQRVNVGDIVGLSGNTGYSTGPHLHISAYAADAVDVQNRPSASCGGKTYTMPISPVDAYLDPMLYFPNK